MTHNQRRTLSVVHPHAAGVDIGSREIYVAARASPDSVTIRTFGVFTDDLEALVAWLISLGIVDVAMESTGVYWIALYDALVARGIRVCLVNPRELKQVPGRKSDIKDCQWLQELHAFGLLRASFRPDAVGCVIRSLSRQRQDMTDAAGRQLQLMQKALIQMNIRLPEVVSDIAGKTGMAIIRDIIAGVRDPVALAAHRDGRCRADATVIARALRGVWRNEHLLALRQALQAYDVYRGFVTEVEREIEAVLAAQAPRPRPPEDTDSSSNAVTDQPRKRKKNKGDYAFDIRQAWHRITGIDITAIAGVGDHALATMMAEVGLQIDKFSTPQRFTSWLGLAPTHDITGGKVIRRGSRHGNSRCVKALCLAAHAAGRTDTDLGFFYRKLAARRGAIIAIKATARKIAERFWLLLVKGVDYMQATATEAEQKFRRLKIASITKQAKKLGLQLLVPQQDNFS